MVTSSTNANPASTVVACQRLVKIFRDFWMRPRARAVDDVTFDINRGEVFGLLGPNGSGKSTTIKILLGLLHRTSGRVVVLGRRPSDVAVKRKIGYLPEESYLYPFLNARETLDYYGKLFELDHRTRKRRIDELLDMVGLTSVQFRQVREYSKGMQRRIGIAQALINDPELLILDEPTTGLDPIGTRQIKDLILSLGRRGKTVLLSSHLLSDVEDCVDRMVILYGGKVRAEGTCDSLLTTQDGSIIETDRLDDATISEIDAVIRRRTGGASSISRVAKPRQKLEDLFISIVEKARAERAATSGAQHGGATAAFLKGQDEAAEGESLISKLVSAGAAPSEDAQAAREAELEAAAQRGRDSRAAEPDADVLKQLLTSASNDMDSGALDEAYADDTAGAPAPSAPAAPKVPKDVDLGVIGSLLDEPAAPERPAAPDKPGPKDRGRKP